MRYSLLIVTLVLSFTWVAVPLSGDPRWMGSLVTFAVLAVCLTRTVREGEWGLDMRAFLPALSWVVPLTVPVLGLFLLVGWKLETLRPRENPLLEYSFLYLWALGQQFALQTVLFREAQEKFGVTPGIWIAAGLFGLLHFPNPFLTSLTFGAGLVWCWIYSRHPNLLPLALSHSSSTLFILLCLDREITGRMRVGYSYLLLN